MNPEERALLERAIKLSEENNIILKNLEKQAKWARVWGFAKIIILVLPFIIGYLYFAPIIGSSLQNYEKNISKLKDLLQ
jgi:hypothetical protein